MNTMNTMTGSSGIGLGLATLLCATPAPACPPDGVACETTAQAITLRTVDGAGTAIRDGSAGFVLDTTANVVLAGTDDERANVWVGALAGADDDERLGADAKTMEISLADGKVSVRINGKEVPADRIRHEKGRIVVLDADGKEIESIRIGMPSRGMFEAEEDIPLDVREILGGTPGVLDAAELEEPKVMLGILLDEPGPALRHHFDLEPGTTTMISALYKGLPAHAAGLDQYDVIVEIEGAAPADPASLRAALADREPGDTIELTVVHRGRAKRVAIALDAYDRAAMAEAEMIGEAPRATMQFDQFFPDGLRGFDITTEIPEIQDFRFGPDGSRQRIFVTPRKDVFELAPAPPRAAPQPRGKQGGSGDEMLDERLQRLDRRLAELEKMLDAVLERANAKKGGTR